MFDFGFVEILLIIVVAVLVIGPDDMPGIMRSLGKGVRRLQYIRFAFSQQFEDFMKEHDLNELRNHIDVQDNTPEKDPAKQNKMAKEAALQKRKKPKTTPAKKPKTKKPAGVKK